MLTISGPPYLLSVPTLTFKTLHVLVFIAHGRRELVHVNVTAPDGILGVAANDRGHALAPETTPSAPRSRCRLWPRLPKARPAHRHRCHRHSDHAPKANAIAERVIGTLRRECLDRVIVLDEQHLRSVLTQFVRYYNNDRPHRTRGLQTPELKERPTTGIVQSRPVLNGLHHIYERAA
jgi:transposase InsO family protein